MAASVRRLLVVLAMAGAGLVPAPAMASGYCAGSGVNVVVDFGALGGSLEKGCGTGSTAAAVFTSAGVSLSRDGQYPGVVCKVEGRPADANCSTMPAGNAYWGLFWSDGTSRHWVYSSYGVDSLKVPNGGFVGFAWQASTSQRAPAATPANPRPSPSPTPVPTRQPTKHAATRPAAGVTTSAAPTPSPSASATATPSRSASAAAKGSPSASSSGLPSPSTSVSVPAAAAGPQVARVSASTAHDGGLPWWVPVVVLLALAAGGGAVWRIRGRGTT